ncbi:uncharacterized protein C8Q71DRAFT_847695 [Rhodofomes roseus]|uniref:F-box domain-containing protein n=1 Tax=Rhodofomes roseus TaxID=34475 RepID=A0ABQ8KJH1_9APHY|nr:uncharacterized protein C8Q71DRAFT_847695 [Rhodofomes roseus]KAH9837955.1 hypothetical protein C8Q71DRAFT_847695 [Rhodofomes roseus]
MSAWASDVGEFRGPFMAAPVSEIYGRCGGSFPTTTGTSFLSERDMSSLESTFESLSVTTGVRNPFHHELLPPEIWVDVIGHCNKASQRTCLSLSRVFHSHTIPILFYEIIICSGGRAGKSGTLRRAGRNAVIEVVRPPALDASFAKVVKALEVEAYMKDGSRVHLLLSESSMLLLRRVQGYRISLFRRHAHFTFRILSYVALPFHKLKRLRWIAFSWTHEDIIDPLLSNYQDVEINEETFPDLCELHFFFTTPASGHLLGGLSKQITHLNLLFIRDLGRLEVLLHNLPDVQSLTLQTLRETQEEQLFTAFTYAPFKLPRLTQLKIRGDENYGDVLLSTNVTLLAEVLRGIPTLQCFDCSFRIAATHLQLISSAISSLQHLTVLGLCIGRLAPTRGSMPPALDALALFMSGGFLDEYGLTELWTRCQRLRFLYLCTYSADDVEITPQDLATAGNSLKLVGLGNAFHYVEREGGDVKVSEQWSDGTVAFRRVDDFECPEWEWLMRETIIW